MGPLQIAINPKSWLHRNDEYTVVPLDEGHPSGSRAQFRKEAFLRDAVLPNFWFVTTLILLIIVAHLHSNVGGGGNFTSDYEHGFGNELDEPKTAIKLEQRRFTNAIRASENGSLFPYSESEEPRYVGVPNPDIDKAWEELLRGRYIRFTDAEAEMLNQDVELPKLEKIGSPGSQPEEGFYGGPDMLHSLHCLNAVRKHLDLEYYEAQMTMPFGIRRMHIDHCLDQLRQAIMCHGDLTPVSLKPVLFQEGQRLILYYLGQTERLHTCRDARAIRDWVTQRGEERGSLDVF